MLSLLYLDSTIFEYVSKGSLGLRNKTQNNYQIDIPPHPQKNRS
ncbi:hypothetical protein LV89_01805 [Arcicella aurantiaca]|uniref:Uncharacterized protein n=1 Tax=Arcicella aurantiaca TaxID=591202 RepID=A0A316E8B0_9BACT|nr:hypothetical protein [Arcicella aurantiaca]PWK26993.1 hypothetical protein LV89_01805 [Arcicella aurantiaca]